MEISERTSSMSTLCGANNMLRALDPHPGACTHPQFRTKWLCQSPKKKIFWEPSLYGSNTIFLKRDPKLLSDNLTLILAEFCCCHFLWIYRHFSDFKKDMNFGETIRIFWNILYLQFYLYFVSLYFRDVLKIHGLFK